jgi:peptide/nickel transport system substrate-binding protein
LVDGSESRGSEAVKRFAAVAAFALCTFGASAANAIVLGKPVHGLAMYGEPKLPPDFTHYPFNNPDAPKGGVLTRAAIGTFDSFNAFIFKGNKPHPAIIQYMGNGHYFYFNEPLMARTADEPGVWYCLVCETVEMAPDRMWIEFSIRPEARFHDGSSRR